ncbi:MAG: hypothetical protein K0B02_01105 [DPANN group archaeon]|nr:hypothetical protein [DPANN group archaeon]
MIEIIGILGMFLILSAFLLDELNTKIDRDSVLYNVINCVGAAFLTYYAYSINSIPFIVLNVIWFAVALIKLIGIEKKRL